MQLRLSERWVRKLLAHLREEGERGIVRRLRGRAPKRRLPEAVRQRVVKLVKRKYADFRATLAAEYLAELHGVQVGKETLRQMLTAAGGGGTCLASPAGLLEGAGAVGDLGARLARGAGNGALFVGHGRRHH